MTPALNDAAVMEVFGLCVVAFVIIVALHLMGLHMSIRIFRARFGAVKVAQLKYHQAMLLVLSAMMLLFLLHMLTNVCWGAFMYWAGALPVYRECMFYSFENYTSLGLTRVNVGEEWRMLAPMISLSGVFCLSWTTALLVSFFGQVYSVRMDD